MSTDRPAGLCTPLLTLAVAALSGLLGKALGLPVPFLLGSLFGVWLLGGMVPATRPRLGIPRPLHIVVVVGLGVLIGAMFRPELFSNAARWVSTVIAMLTATVVATAAGYQFLTRIRGYPRSLAILCCLPGGQAEIVAISRDLVDKDYVVALCHLVRVALVFCLTPLVLTIAFGQAAVDASNAVLDSLPGLTTLSGLQIFHFLLLAVAGYFPARWLGVPMPHLLGPLVLSAVAHTLGWLDVPRISELVLLAQLVIGSAIGARLSQVPVRALSSYVKDAVANALLVIAVYLIIALSLSRFMSAPLSDLLLSFVPGGLYEVTLLALIFGFDVVFVTFHHTIRISLIFVALPLLCSSPAKKDIKSDVRNRKTPDP